MLLGTGDDALYKFTFTYLLTYRRCRQSLQIWSLGYIIYFPLQVQRRRTNERVVTTAEGRISAEKFEDTSRGQSVPVEWGGVGTIRYGDGPAGRPAMTWRGRVSSMMRGINASAAAAARNYGQIPLCRLPRDVRDEPVTSLLAQIPLRWHPSFGEVAA